MASHHGPAAEEKESAAPDSWHGDEAFWTGDAHAGALYVLGAGTVVRISVGGVSDEEERIQRSKTLAQAALNRVQLAPRLASPAVRAPLASHPR